MEVPIEISFDSDKSKRRAPPARFAARMKAKEQEEKPKDSPKPVKEVQNEIKDLKIRTIRNPIQKDTRNPCSLDDAIVTLTNFCPTFVSKKEIIDTDPKWQEKVKAMTEITEFIKENGKDNFDISEPSIIYILSFSKEFKAANMNIVKCSLDCIKNVVETCGVGPRIVERIVTSLIPKIHDRKLGNDCSELILLMGEQVGLSPIVSSLCSGMSKSKIPLQQKAAVSLLQRIINEFGAIHLDIKSLLAYLLSEQALTNTHVDVKNQTIAVFCDLYKQIGPAIQQLLENSGVNELLLKSIRESLETVSYDASLAAAYTTAGSTSSTSSAGISGSTGSAGISGSTSSTGSTGPVDTPAPAPVQLFSIDDLVTAADISSEIPGLIKMMNNTDGKESWKIRQQGIIDFTTLLKQKQRIVNNKAVSEIVAVLKVRLSETHLMLKAKVLQCIGQLAEALGDDITQYNGVLFSEMMKLTNESNKVVIETLYSTLTQWVAHSTKSTGTMFQSVAFYLAAGLKSGKGRFQFLHWLNQYLTYGEKKCLVGLVPGCIDCLLDRTKEVRNEALQAIKTISKKCGRGCIDDEVRKRRHADVLTLTSALQGVLNEGMEEMDRLEEKAMQATQAMQTMQASEKEDRFQSLANRPGARVLTKRTTPAVKRTVSSSIPKPEPPLKKQNREEEVKKEIEPPLSSEVEPVLPQEPVVFPTPAMSCSSLHPSLDQKESLLSQKELVKCSEITLPLSLPSLSYLPSVFTSFSSMLQQSSSPSPMMTLEVAVIHNSFIESCTQICYLLDPKFPISQTPAFSSFKQSITPTARQEIISVADSLLRILLDILNNLLSQKNHGLPVDNSLLVHGLNVISCLILVGETAVFQPSSITLLLSFLMMGLFTSSHSIQCTETECFYSISHHILYQLIDHISIPLLIHSLCLFLQQVQPSIHSLSESSLFIILMKRIFSVLLTRINSIQLEDRVKMDCVEKLRTLLPASLNICLKCEVDRCIHVLEPVHVTSPSFGEVLKSANQMLTSPSLNTNLTTTTMLKSQMESFKQRYLANRQNVEITEMKEEKVETVETPEMTEKEQEQEERMKYIREQMNQRRLPK